MTDLTGIPQLLPPPPPGGITKPTTPPAIPAGSYHTPDQTDTPPVQTASPFPFEPGKGTSELKVVAVLLAGNVGIVVAVLAHLGISLTGDQVTSVLQWIGVESGLVTTAYAGFRSWRKR